MLTEKRSVQNNRSYVMCRNPAAKSEESVEYIRTHPESLPRVAVNGQIHYRVHLPAEKEPSDLVGWKNELHVWYEGRSSEMRSVCRESVHRVFICAFQTCAVCAENLCT